MIAAVGLLMHGGGAVDEALREPAGFGRDDVPAPEFAIVA